MRIAYFECATGISGDMTLGALIDAGIDVEAIRAGIASLQLPSVVLKADRVIKAGFHATYVQVLHPEQHAHRHLSDILQLIDAADAMSDGQKSLAKRIFTAVAEAEACVHGSDINKVHFHEVGAIDSIVDIVGAAIGLDLLNVDHIACGPIPTGRGDVRIAHGICPVPTPGTAELLKGIPLRDVPIQAELTTPTGAAIVKTVADRFGSLPEMTVDQIGYGAGTRDLPDRANVLRLFVGSAVRSSETDQVCLFETNLDDVSSEVIGYTKHKLLEAGALDVYSTAIQMKKDRPGTILSVICQPGDVESLESIVFDQTATFGIRRHFLERSKRLRETHSVATPWGAVEGKLGWLGAGRPVFTPEFESCARIADTHNIPLRDVYRAAECSFGQSGDDEPLNIDRGVISELSHHEHQHSHSHTHQHKHSHNHEHHHSGDSETNEDDSAE